MRSLWPRWCLVAAVGVLMGSTPPIERDPADPEAMLRVHVGNQVTSVTLNELQGKLTPQKVKIFNPAYKKELEYEGFWLEDVLKAIDFPANATNTDIALGCNDGYTAMLAPAQIGQHQWFLSYQEATGDWTPLKKKKDFLSPAPWYLVNVDRATYDGIPWPYQVRNLSLIQH